VSKHYYEGDSMVGRAESPAIEHAFQDECSRLLKELFESKGLYQNVRINESIFASLPADFQAEFKKRPIAAHSRGEGDDNPLGPRFGGGTQPLETPHDEMEVGFYLPNINLDCHKCTRAATFLSMTCSARNIFADPYPLIADETEQVFSAYYRCALCRKAYVVFQVRRTGLKFQLTGRSAPFRPTIAKEWPKSIVQIVTDAFVASAEGDIPAAYYHLRTAAEFYLKDELHIPVTQKMEGADLCERYNAIIDARLKSGFPSFITMYTELSEGLHTRNVSTERFTKICNDFIAHFKAKELFAHYSAT
jgi:hypothetical protein